MKFDAEMDRDLIDMGLEFDDEVNFISITKYFSGNMAISPCYTLDN